MIKIITDISILIFSFIVFWLIILPLSLIMKLLNFKTLDLTKHNKKTYWIKKKNKNYFN